MAPKAFLALLLIAMCALEFASSMENPSVDSKHEHDHEHGHEKKHKKHKPYHKHPKHPRGENEDDEAPPIPLEAVESQFLAKPECVRPCEAKCKSMSHLTHIVLPCKKACIACCLKAKCVPFGDKKCPKWNYVLDHEGKKLLCP